MEGPSSLKTEVISESTNGENQPSKAEPDSLQLNAGVDDGDGEMDDMATNGDGEQTR